MYGAAHELLDFSSQMDVSTVLPSGSSRDAPQVQFHIVKVQKLIKFPHFIWSIFNKVPIWFNRKIQKLLKIPHYFYLYFKKVPIWFNKKRPKLRKIPPYTLSLCWVELSWFPRPRRRKVSYYEWQLYYRVGSQLPGLA